jgi:succinate dehydrogenase/fumarate reductase flavoprotein subunit
VAKAVGCGCRSKAQDPRDPREIPASERYYFLEERYPTYGNLVPRDIATREIFDVCVNHGLSVEQDRLCVYLDVTELPAPTAEEARRHPGDLREVPGG